MEKNCVKHIMKSVCCQEQKNAYHKGMANVSFEELKGVRKRHKNERIVFCSGTFDIVHAGHTLFLEDCKKHGDILVVMVANDAIIKRDKNPTRPVMNEHLRLAMVNALKPVDYTYLDQMFDVSWEPIETLGKIFMELRPDVYVVNSEARGGARRGELAVRHGVHMITLERACPPEFEGISTTSIIEKVKSMSREEA
jgi:D-beta-D-heptose 7-phosphate kinase/D-beta-D-heptose 1-phosphate adenosyltransferase